MKRVTDKELDRMLSNLCEAEPEASFVYRQSHAKPAVVPFVRYRRIAAAAALVLVSALSVSLFFLLGGRTNGPVVIAPSATDSTGAASGEDASTPLLPIPPNIDSTQTGETDTTAPQPATDAQGHLIPESTTPSSTVSPTQNGTAPTTVPSTSETTQSPTHIPSPTQTPTVPPVILPTSPPTEAPWIPDMTEPPDGPSIEDPTYNSTEPWEPEDPTESGVNQDPESTAPPYSATFTARVRESQITTGVYCKVYNSSGKMIGDRDLYAGSHRVTVLSYDGVTAILSYKTPEGLIPHPGYYNYVFYDMNGKMLAQGQAYVG